LALRQGDWKLRFTKKPEWTGKKAKFPDAPVELYNLLDDPNEKQDLAASEPERKTAMEATLLDLLNAGRSR
tara:strand:+ start:923 stop:1135 length:213 start_codon:yes stop_codon:yes gene_type:complete